MSKPMSLRALPGLAVLLAIPPGSAPAAPAALPAVQRTLSAPVAARACTAAATASTVYRAPMAGFATVRLAAAGGDWDLTVRDASSRRILARSHAFGSREVAQAWVDAGQRLLVAGCRRAGGTATAVVSVELVDARRPAATRPMLVALDSPSARLGDALRADGFDVAENNAELIVPGAAQLRLLDRRGVGYRVAVPDMLARDARARAADLRLAAAGPSPLPSGRSTYRFLADYQDELKQIVDTYGVGPGKPGIARPVTIGTTFQGRPIQGVELASDVAASDDGRPTYLLMAMHHAREWPSAEIAMEFAWLLAKSYGQTDADGVKVTDLLARERVVIVPLVNVDGFVASRGENASGTPLPDPEDTLQTGGLAEGIALGGSFAYRRKNCDGTLPGATQDNDVARSLPCYYQHGVDPNRNYGFNWGGPGASNDPLSQTYRGAGQWSEPETQAVHAYSQTHPVTAMITLHNVAALVLRPPGLHTDGQAPDENALKELGDRMAKVTGYTSQYSFQLYDTSGTTEDWNYGAAGTLGYTIEIGPSGGDFHMEYRVGVIDQWLGRVRGRLIGGLHDALLFAADAAADPANHPVITGSGTPGATLRVNKQFDTFSAEICTFAQGTVRAGVVPAADCVAPGAVFARTKVADRLEYTTQVRPDGTFEWHITPSTRPFVGFRYENGQRVATGRTEAWTLTCERDGRVVASRSLVVDRGERLALGEVCA